MTRVNLIPRARRQRMRRQEHQRRWITIAAGYALFIVIALVVAKLVSATDKGALDEELARTNASITTDRATVVNLRRQLGDAAALLKAQYAVQGQPDWGILLALLAEATGDEVVLRECRLQHAAGGIGGSMDIPGAAGPRTETGMPPTYLELGGLGRSQNTVTQFVLRMDEIPLFRKVHLQDTRREPFGEGHAIAFRVVCMLDTEEGAAGP
ncbi:MAG: hypothetical protein GY715_12495 [Planctomycetes bacterium]|nr:hypothetical protein [Planctomycetota bacterium]